MKIENSAQVLEMVTVAEAARKLSACQRTLSRRVASSGIASDAILLLGTTPKRSPLFVASRIGELAALLKK